jgi:hypothetical protein
MVDPYRSNPGRFKLEGAKRFKGIRDFRLAISSAEQEKTGKLRKVTVNGACIRAVRRLLPSKTYADDNP